jgi:hypothetical protein
VADQEKTRALRERLALEGLRRKAETFVKEPAAESKK